MSHPSARLALRPEEAALPEGHPLRRLPAVGAVAALLGIVGSAVLGMANPAQFFFSWLVAFLFFLSLAIGALYFVLIHYAVQAAWGVVLRRVAETVAATLPVLALLFVPLVFGMGALFPWSRPDAHTDHLLAWKAPFLNTPFFLVRAAIYFAAWSAIALLWLRGSRAQDATGDVAISLRLRRRSGPALLVLAITQTFASIDWIMSLTPKWFSTAFGVYFFSGAMVSFFSLLAIAAVVLRNGPLRDVISVEHLHDVGKLVFAFVCFWAYIGFCQYFLIWYANLPEETGWYHVRLSGAWKSLTMALAIGHFVIPFLFLMGRTVKRRGAGLLLGAGWVLLMHLLDIYWLVMPSLHEAGARPGLLDAATFLAVGGVFTGAVGWLLARQPLVPLRDPRLAESLALENA